MQVESYRHRYVYIPCNIRGFEFEDFFCGLESILSDSTDCTVLHWEKEGFYISLIKVSCFETIFSLAITVLSLGDE